MLRVVISVIDLLVNKISSAEIQRKNLFYSHHKTHIVLLRLLDKKGLSIVSKLHV